MDKTFEEIKRDMQDILKKEERSILFGQKLIRAELREIFGEDLKEIENIKDDEFLYGGDMFYAKLKDGYILMPQDDRGQVRLDSISKLDESWLKRIVQTLDYHKDLKQDIERTIGGLEELVESQRLRKIFMDKE